MLDQVEHGIAQARPDDPAHGGAAQRDEPEGQDGVEGDLAGERVGGARAQDHCARRAAAQRHERAEAHLPPPPRLAQLEERVPVQGWHVRVRARVGLGPLRRARRGCRVGVVVCRGGGMSPCRCCCCWLAADCEC